MSPGYGTDLAFVHDAGYQSVSAFVSVFRRTLGQTPGRYFRRTRDDVPPLG